VPDTEKKRAFETYELTLAESTDLAPREKNLLFKLPAGKTLHFKAGQFAQLFIPNGDKVKRTAYSIASSPQRTDGFELCVTHVDGGVSSTYLHNMKVGDKIQGMAPLGTFVLKDESRDFVFVSTGSGIAPFRSMIGDLSARGVPKNMTLLYGHRYEPDLLYRTEWESLQKANPRFKYYPTLSRDTAWTGAKGYVQTHIENAVPDPKSANYYICGLNNMITAVNEKLLSLGVPPAQIHFERYD
jgi:ferredoxin-NADP reductase